MTPLPAPSPVATAPTRSGAGSAGGSEAASAFALLLAGVLPIPVLAAVPMTTPLGIDPARLAAEPAPPEARAGLPDASTQSGAQAGATPVSPAGPVRAPQAPGGAEITAGPAGAGRAAQRPLQPGLPSIIDPDRPPAPPLDRGQAAARQTAADQASLANIASPGDAEPAGQAAPAKLGQSAAEPEVANRTPAEARLSGTGAIDPRAVQAAPPRLAAENLARAVGENPSDRPASALPESSPVTGPGAEPDRRSVAGAPEPALAGDGPPKARPAAIPTSTAAGDAHIDPSVEIGDAAPGRTERVAGETPGPAGRPLPPAPVVQLAIHIAGAASRRVERLVVQLEPAALGRVEVRLDFTHDNRVSAVIAAERPETLEVLQRDSRALERGLQDAGLRLDQNALSFSLRQEQRGQERGAGMPGTWLAFEAPPGSSSGAERPDDARPAYWLGAHRVLDIRI
jgi:flagellar hook-length control protein FliK